MPSLFGKPSRVGKNMVNTVDSITDIRDNGSMENFREVSSLPVVLDLFAGPDGWSEGLRTLGLREIGIELDASACATRAAAGHLTVRADVTQYPTAPFVGRISGLIASAPCQAWSSAGKRKGELDRANCHRLADRMAAGDDSTTWTTWEDERSPLVCQPIRWARDLCPEWIALEEVPGVASLFEHFARILAGWGYATWTGDVNAADYGIPQSRIRRILMASRTAAAVSPPEPTHSRTGHLELFGYRAPWVTMAEALGWGYRTRPAPTVSADSEPFSGTSRQAMRAVMDNPRHWAWRRPSHTIGCTIGHVTGKQAEGHLNLELEEAARLQGFPDGYPWRGNKGKRTEQVGNAVPPPLAAAIVGRLVGVSVDQRQAEAAA